MALYAEWPNIIKTTIPAGTGDAKAIWICLRSPCMRPSRSLPTGLVAQNRLSAFPRKYAWEAWSLLAGSYGAPMWLQYISPVL
jgi:hypothetical protein